MFSKNFICATEKRNTYISNVNAPYMRKNLEFSLLPEEISITVCGIGFYEIYVNGVKVTKGKLAPYISDPDNICYYAILSFYATSAALSSSPERAAAQSAVMEE